MQNRNLYWSLSNPWKLLFRNNCDRKNILSPFFNIKIIILECNEICITHTHLYIAIIFQVLRVRYLEIVISLSIYICLYIYYKWDGLNPRLCLIRARLWFSYQSLAGAQSKIYIYLQTQESEKNCYLRNRNVV